MALNINRPGKAADSRPRLSRLGKIVVALLAAAAILTAVFVFVNSARNTRVRAAEQVVTTAIERVVTVSRQALGADSTPLDQALSQMDGERDVKKRTQSALSLLEEALKSASGNTALTDELNGARNRLLLALEGYEKEK